MRGFVTLPEHLDGEKVRKRSATFSDHYSQARQFFRSMTPTEQTHIVSALAFELAHVEKKEIRLRMLGHLANIDGSLHKQVAVAMGVQEPAVKIEPAVAPRDLKPSPAVSILTKAPVSLAGHKVGILITDGFDRKQLTALRAKVKAAKATVAVIAPKVGGARDSAGEMLEADLPISAAPSVFYDAVAILASEAGAKDLSTQAVAVDWVADAFAHLKVIAHTAGAQPLLDKAGVLPDAGVLAVSSDKSLGAFIETAKKGRVWDREPALRRPG